MLRSGPDFDHAGGLIKVEQQARNGLLAPAVGAANQTGLPDFEGFILQQVGQLKMGSAHVEWIRAGAR
ncbi:MAG: hypothetical protein B7Y96_07600 [Comamonadaceae bacterium 32-67-11]|nr:MAG: hypothetical protein B7Y96_07600 [Comamonadaceae bacterium 32-67-11]